VATSLTELFSVLTGVAYSIAPTTTKLTKAGTAVTKLTTPLANTARGIADGKSYPQVFPQPVDNPQKFLGDTGLLGIGGEDSPARALPRNDGGG
jgi:hypothetical protein